MRFHFSYYEYNREYREEGWIIRELHLFLGADEFIYYQHHENTDKNQRGCLSVNTKHLLFAIIDQLCGQPLDQMAKESEFCNGEFELTDDWLRLKDVRMRDSALEWLYDADFSELEYHEPVLGEAYHTANILRDLLSGMIEIPSAIAARFAKLESVPPLRPVPKKMNPVFAFFHQIALLMLTKPEKVLPRRLKIENIAIYGIDCSNLISQS